MRAGAKHNFRLLLFMAQGGCCMICGESMSFNRKKTGAPARDFATFEHIERREQGGKISTDNIVLTHAKCNLRRDREFHEQNAALTTSQRAEK